MSVYVHFNGETKTVKQWADITKIPYAAIFHRLKHGWSIERALTEPINAGKIEYKGRLYSYRDLGKLSPVHWVTVRNRIKAGWPVEQAVTTPNNAKRVR